jgi:threonine/homoserine/homoserine lactone efflux protein
MGKILTLVLGLAVLGYLGYRTMYAGARTEADATPKARLENVQGAARRIEAEGDARLKGIEDTTRGE